MTIIVAEVYDALKSAGADDDKAIAAAAAVATVATVAADGRERDIADMKADIRAIKWMLVFSLAGTLATFAMLVRLSFPAG